jgi:molybdenum cofactor biosynthesis enzyme MoaA
MTRVFGADGRLLHDPVTGLTHLAPAPYTRGRHHLDAAAVTALPPAVPAHLDRDMPVSICWSPIVRCNLACPQCLDDASVREAGPAQRARTASILADADILGVDISGGEPLLLRDLPDLAHTIAGGRRAAVSVTTNGWHLARRAAELAPAVDGIRVSLDGPDTRTHDRIRGDGSFRRAVDGITAATEAGLTVQIQTVLMASTAHRAQEIVDLAAQVGAASVTFLQMLPIGSGAALTGQMLTDEQATRVLDGLTVPASLRVRLRARNAAAGFTVVRADSHVWRNDPTAHHITGLRPLTGVADLALTGRDGSA